MGGDGIQIELGVELTWNRDEGWEKDGKMKADVVSFYICYWKDE